MNTNTNIDGVDSTPSSTICSKNNHGTSSQKRSHVEICSSTCTTAVVVSEESQSDSNGEKQDAKKCKIDKISTPEVAHISFVEKSPTKKSEEDIPIIDVCATLTDSNNQPITRIQVKWDLHVDNPSPTTTIPRDESTTTSSQTNDTTTEHTSTSNKKEIWWGATLLPHDGTSYHILRDESSENTDQNSNIKVPLRTLDYDPYPSLGFTEPEIAQVVFTNHHSCMDIHTQQSFWFRAEGSNWTEEQANCHQNDKEEELVSLTGEEGLTSILDSVLTTTFDQNPLIQQKFQKMSRAQQCLISDKIRLVKEKMVEKLMQQSSSNGAEEKNSQREITPDDVKQCMQEIGAEMMKNGERIG